MIHAVPQLARHLDRGLQSAREALVRLCEAYRARRGDIGQVYVVFDGRDDEYSGASDPSTRPAKRGSLGMSPATYRGVVPSEVEGRRSGAPGLPVGLQQPRGRVTLCFTRAPEEADQRILRLIEAKQPDRCLVVSNDNEVFNNARAHGARVISAQEFSQPARPAKASRGRSDHEAPKRTLSIPDALRITDEYRKHLESRKRPA